MNTIYILWFNNGLEYEDNKEWIKGCFSTLEGLENYITNKSLEQHEDIPNLPKGRYYFTEMTVY